MAYGQGNDIGVFEFLADVVHLLEVAAGAATIMMAPCAPREKLCD
jgi:hypothetical protein